MKLHDFITYIEIQEVARKIEDKKDFYIEREVGEYRFRIRSSYANGNWENGTKDGDYFVGVGFSTKTRGNSRPISGNKLKELEDVENLTKYLDDYMKSNRIEGYEIIDEGQVDMFSLAMEG